MGFITILLFAIIIIAFITLSTLYSNLEYTYPNTPTIMCFVLFFIIYSALLVYRANKTGQIQVLSGSNIKYELKENPDKTKEWVEIKSKNK